MQRIILLLFTLITVPMLSSVNHHEVSSATDFDLIISRGHVVDGTGNPWFEADIAIKDGRIVEIGKVETTRAARTIDAKGLIVTPGFIDVHTHIESNIGRLPAAENFLRMGVISVVTGNCGGSASNLGEWFAELEKTGISINIASLVGHNTVRRAGMNGDFDRPPTPEELEKMLGLVDKAMRDGAVGLSTGLEYIPGTYAKTDEIVELAKVAARHGGVYATHMRDEGEFVEKSIRESIEIGEKAGCPVEISHFKISSKKRWGASVSTIKMVEDARARGLQVTVDQYLYPAGSTGIGILFPSWLFEGGSEKAKEKLQDAATRERVRRELIDKAKAQGFRDFAFAFVANHQTNQTFNGKNIAEVTKMVKNKSDANSQAEQIIDILQAGGAQMVLHKMSEGDVERIFKQPFTMVASDAGVIEPGSASIPHPRGFGNNARVLGIYVREKKLLGLEEAVRKMTSLPAQTFNLWDRGLLRPGMAADLVIFDERTVIDRATFQEPKQFPVGIDYVIVNGQVVIERGMHNGIKSGKILHGR
ncbi:MAG: D-aminoacylase [Acidobacteria bacterium]|nr:D-aminoacylase [Acidobacteriota bacterium]MCI0664620.1 D-aminoacylase [Acidobacteriota bacterium]